jgi:hypothetical protein
MAHKTVTLKCSELVEDFSIYPRNCVFDGHVYDIAEAIRAGAAFPPVVACSKSKLITDGFHRRRGEVRVHGDDASIECMLVDYKNDAEMVCDAIARNATHGRRMTTADIARCAGLAEEFRISRTRLADLLHITRDRLKDITASRFANGAGGPVVLRRPMQHFAGRKLTKAQEAVAAHVGGQTAIYHVNVLIKLIESNSLPLDDERLIERMRQLHAAMEGLLVA